MFNSMIGADCLPSRPAEIPARWQSWVRIRLGLIGSDEGQAKPIPAPVTATCNDVIVLLSQVE